MNATRMRGIPAVGLVIGAIFGMAGSFAPSPALRQLAWGIDGTALIVAAALLTIFHLRRGHDLVAAGFLVFSIGEAFILSASAMDLDASAPAFVTGVALWSASLIMISASDVMPALVRGFGFMSAVLFSIVALQILAGRALTPLTQPLPFFAYPFFAATLFGWAWAHYTSHADPESGRNAEPRPIATHARA